MDQMNGISQPVWNLNHLLGGEETGLVDVRLVSFLTPMNGLLSVVFTAIKRSVSVSL
jgi:hypothetical protein